jgi:uncharacterized protein YaeQ
VLEFGKDMWEADEPALSQHDLTGLLMHWIELGQPDEKRLVRVCGRSKRVTVYSYGSTAPAWWAGLAGKVCAGEQPDGVADPGGAEPGAGALAERSMDLQITLQDGVLFVGEGERSVEITPVRLFGGE